MKRRTHKEQTELASQYLFKYARLLQAEADRMEALGMSSRILDDEVITIKDLAEVLQLGLSTEK